MGFKKQQYFYLGYPNLIATSWSGLSRRLEDAGRCEVTLLHSAQWQTNTSWDSQILGISSNPSFYSKIYGFLLELTGMQLNHSGCSGRNLSLEVGKMRPSAPVLGRKPGSVSWRRKSFANSSPNSGTDQFCRGGLEPLPKQWKIDPMLYIPKRDHLKE